MYANLGPIEWHPICKGVGHLPVKILKKHAFPTIFLNPKIAGKNGVFNRKKIKIRSDDVASLIKWLISSIHMYVWKIQALPKGFGRLASTIHAENLELPPFFKKI